MSTAESVLICVAVSCCNFFLLYCRVAMFFITVGILTEYWTGQSFPQQVETMASVIGLLPLDYESVFTSQ
jgi:hypothetical protein